MSGWNLSAALLLKQVENLGTVVAKALANFDPETATEVDRDNLKNNLRETSTQLAAARRELAKETAEATTLAAQIKNDEAAAAILITKAEAGEIDDATLTEFADNLEAMKARLPGEEQDVTAAQELVSTLEEILKGIEKSLSDFETAAKRALQARAQAQADLDREEQRLRHQEQLAALQTGKASSLTALSALNASAEKLRVAADAKRIQADIGQKPLDRQNAVEEARRVAAGAAAPATLSAVDRLRGLTAK